MRNMCFLVNDLVVMEDVCNSNCSYCITSGSQFKDKHKLSYYEDKLKFNLDKLLDGNNTYQDGKELKRNLDYITDILLDSKTPGILKISGGEIFLVKGIIDFIKKEAQFYRRIQVLTNAILLNEDLIKELATIKNLCLQISMDGHLLEMNKYRVQNQRVQDKLCIVLELCALYGVPLEINCVLTDANLHCIHTFAGYLKKYSNLLLLPYPIRGKGREKFLPQKNQIIGLEMLIQEYNNLQHILPPKAYLENLRKFILEDRRESACRIPFLIYQTFDDGVVTPCPNIWYKSMGNLLVDPSNTLDRIGKDTFYLLLKRNTCNLDQCVHCYTPWDILNLFLDKKITIKDMEKIHLYNHPDILKYLLEAADEIK